MLYSNSFRKPIQMPENAANFDIKDGAKTLWMDLFILAMRNGLKFIPLL